MKKTLANKMNYNNFLIKVYPKEYTDQRKSLEDENDRLKQQIEVVYSSIFILQDLKRGNEAFDFQLQLAMNPELQDVKRKIDD